MIWQQNPHNSNGEFLLISQHDHSLLSGQLAQKLGNALFSPPSPFAPVVHAIAHHDCGWADADLHPSLDLHGLPTHVFESDILTSIAAWEKTVEQLISQDPYCGLLVSLHTLALATLAATRQPEPQDEFARQRAFRVRRFMHRQIEIQESLRRTLDMRTDLPLRGGLAEQGRSPDEDLLRFNFFLLELLDQISLNLCYGRLVFHRMEMLYPRPGDNPITARFGGDPATAMTLHPWPFNAEQFDLQIPARQIPPGPYCDAPSLWSACQSAGPCIHRVVLKPLGS